MHILFNGYQNKGVPLNCLHIAFMSLYFAHFTSKFSVAENIIVADADAVFIQRLHLFINKNSRFFSPIFINLLFYIKIKMRLRQESGQF